MNAIWGENLANKPNLTLGFVLSFPKHTHFNLRLAAQTVFQVFLDGKLVCFGPNRTSIGYARVSDMNLDGQHLVIKVHSHFINSYAYIKQPPFFACEIVTVEGKHYQSKDFRCYLLHDRVQKVARYSYQRGFSEVYRIGDNPAKFLVGKSMYPQVSTVKVKLPRLLESETSYPKLNEHHSELLESGAVEHSSTPRPIWRPNFITLVGDKLEGYPETSWDECPLDEVKDFLYEKGKNAHNLKYEIYDFKRSLTGFFNLHVELKSTGPVYVLFDEILVNGDIDYQRNNTNNVIKWHFRIKGKNQVCTLEPYTARFVKVIAPKDATIRLSLIDFENDDVNQLTFTSEDQELNTIFQAAKNTLAQNAVDILMDCPSRERAGWLADSYFSSTAEYYYTGKNKVEKAFLENYKLIGKTKLPTGMIPMVYPSDDYDQVFIPNWSLWYILEVAKFHQLHPSEVFDKKTKKIIVDLLAYFSRFENEFGLLENLESWVFVEWSAANDYEHIRGVNIPTNALYAKTLEVAAVLLDKTTLLNKAKKIRLFIQNHAFDGHYFVDNLIRNDQNELVKTNHLTEVCQYYLFWTDAIRREEYIALYHHLMTDLGPYRTESHHHIAPPNMMYGIYMRLDLLMADRQQGELLKECKYYFLKMAQTTITLWENNLPSASCNHGFASYAIRWLVYGLSGYDHLRPESIHQLETSGVLAMIAIPQVDGTKLKLIVEEDKVRM